MLSKQEKTLVREYSQLRNKLNAGLIKSAEFERLVRIEDELVNLYKFTWDELFDAQFGVKHLVASFGRVYQ
jgi:hypothetical protein